MIKILNRWTGAVMHEVDAATVREAVILLCAQAAREDGADLAEANLTRANLAWADLAEADLTEADLTRANLAEANLTRANLTGADLTRANLAEANLTRANLTGADLTEANLTRANLTGANLTALLAGVPVVADLDRRIAEAVGDDGSHLNMANWHSCETTHCRAGWAIRLAGKEGLALEARVGPATAGAMIYLAHQNATGAPLKVPNFFASDADALADIRKCAEAAK